MIRSVGVHPLFRNSGFLLIFSTVGCFIFRKIVKWNHKIEGVFGLNQSLSLIFLYSRAGYKKVLLVAGVIPLCFLIIFLFKIGDPDMASPYLLMERAFGGIWPVLLFVAVLLLGMFLAANSLKNKKDMKATHSTTGYTLRRLRLSPLSVCFTVFLYYCSILLLFWGVAIVSLYVIGKAGLMLSGAVCLDTKLALGILRTEIGHALLPAAHPIVIAFNLIAALALIVTCTRSSYLGWHNGRQSAGVILPAVSMFYVWAFSPESSYVLIISLIIGLCTVFSVGDVISREKHPKGDPFLVNKYIGIMDLDSMDFDDAVYLEVNQSVSAMDALSPDASSLQRYGRITEDGSKKSVKLPHPGWLRRRFMPLGSNLERANTLLGVCIFTGITEHLLFYGRYLLQLNEMKSRMKGVTIDSGLKMPYFSELEAHAYYGYLTGILLVLFLQAYWNYAYYNKETRSIFVMRRLPDRKEYLRTIWIVPVIEALLIAVIMTANTVIDFLWYVMTPDIMLPADYLSHIFSF